MRRVIFLILPLLLLAGPALGYDMLIVRSNESAAVDDVMRGFSTACSADSRLIGLGEYSEADMPRIVREDRPRLVVAIGDEALRSLRNVRHTPVVALVALGLRGPKNPRSNVTGVDLYVSPERYISIFKKLKAERIGVLYDPGKTGWYVQRMASAAQRAGMKLVLRELRSPRETAIRLAELKGKVDALWMVPDTTAVAKDTLEEFFNFSREQSVPVISFTAAHLRHGAAVVVDIDRIGLGRQAGEMANRVLAGTAPSALPVAAPRTTSSKSNQDVLKRLGFPARLLNR